MSNSKQDRRSFLRTAGFGVAALPLIGCGIPQDIDTTSVPAKPASSGPILPKKLKPGDTIAMVAPAGAIFRTHYISAFRKTLQGMGFKVHEGASLKARHGYLAGTDEFRAKELNDLFKNPEIHGIIAMRGGWGCARMLDLIDYDAIAANPKVLMGFSDITSLLIAIYTKTGLITFHGPVGYSSWNHYSSSYVKDILIAGKSDVLLKNPSSGSSFQTISSGKATGKLIGGNLTVVAGIGGSQYLPDWKNKILFLEETREEVYRIDRMLTQLKLAGVLDQISGFVFGACNHCEPEVAEESLGLMEMLEGHLKPLNIPVLFGAAFGHVTDKYTLPVGIEAELDADAGTIQLLAAAVR
jgi:muramoyltetrapeptide carboxypeptidase